MATRRRQRDIQCERTPPASRPDTMRTTLTLLTTTLFAASASAHGAGGTDIVRSARQAAANRPRTIAGVNTVWIEELTQPELRDMIKEHIPEYYNHTSHVQPFIRNELKWRLRNITFATSGA
jgi:hypothetical protein